MGIFSNFFRLFTRNRNIPDELTLESPNGRCKVFFHLKNSDLTYRAERDNKRLINTSRLGFEFTNQAPLKHGFRIIRVMRKSFNETWKPIVGEEDSIINKYNEIAIYLEETGGHERILTLRFRAFDDGFAFRYEFPIQPSGLDNEWIIKDELTEFNFDLNSATWSIPAYQPDRYEYLYEKHHLGSLPSFRHTPLTLKTPNGQYAAIHEASLYNYGAMTLKLTAENRFKTDITPLYDGSRAHIMLPWTTPWRTIIVGDTSTELLTSRMVLNLNDPPREDFSWVKPLKFLGIWWAMFVGEYTWATGDRHGATTEHALEYIDYCRRLGISGLLIEGWNRGWDGSWVDNGDKFDFTTPTPDFDIKKITDHARLSNVEIVGHHETAGSVRNYERQLPRAFEYYRDFGIKYIKLGYVGARMNSHSFHDTHGEFHHSQFGVNHYQMVTELAAKYGMCLNIHEPIKGTGIERTFPNLLTREGARGQEYEGGGITPEHFVIIPFTRGLAGGFDMTPGLFDMTNYLRRTTSTLARQLAFYICVWHGGMVMVADRPWQYFEEQNGFEVIKPAFHFIQDVPLNFSKSKPLLGEIGEFLVIARKDRESEDWFIGGLTNENPRNFTLNLDFLDDGAEYLATLYSDTHDASYRDNPYGFEIKTETVTRDTLLPIFMASGGGIAISLKKIKKS
ncbi:glycoside hydrolase family 97 protein [Candidatus Saccharibacteria bacterium]|nr:glycoside hydrolase family 97 protein [Candidatus Saccharibacteria bacterium]